MLFEKPSLRTRTTFEIAIQRARRPRRRRCSPTWRSARASRSPTSRAISSAGSTRSSSARSRRTTLQEFAAAAPRLHVVNALTDEEHPCQALADFLTLQEHFGPLRGRTIAFVGDGNNVATSLAHAAAMLGVHVHVASPEAISCRTPSCSRRPSVARHGARLRLFTDPADAVAGADAVYTDTWTSMGQEAEGGPAAPGLRRISGERRADVAGQAGRAVHALPAGAPRRGSHRRTCSSPTSRSSSIRPRTGSTARRRCC